jgi:hypothetical protein
LKPNPDIALSGLAAAPERTYKDLAGRKIVAQAPPHKNSFRFIQARTYAEGFSLFVDAFVP